MSMAWTGHFAYKAEFNFDRQNFSNLKDCSLHPDLDNRCIKVDRSDLRVGIDPNAKIQTETSFDFEFCPPDTKLLIDWLIDYS